MTAESDRENMFAAAMKQISALPAHQRMDVLLSYFIDIIEQMEPDDARNLRDQIMVRFSTCGCSFETCRLMIEFVDGHLALRESTSDDRAKTAS